MTEKKEDKILLEALKANGYSLFKDYGTVSGSIDGCKSAGFGYSYNQDGSGIFGFFEVLTGNGRIIQRKTEYTGKMVKIRAYGIKQQGVWDDWSIITGG